MAIAVVPQQFCRVARKPQEFAGLRQGEPGDLDSLALQVLDYEDAIPDESLHLQG
jgi:hypothetical protein